MKAAFSGFRAWAVQRATAIAVLAFVLYVLLQLLVGPPADHAAWRAWFAHPLMRVATLLFFVATALHAWVGTRDILMDYVKPFALRLTLMWLLVLGLLGSVAWAGFALLRL